MTATRYERPITARKVAKDANAWAEKLRRDAAAKKPDAPSVSFAKEWKK